MATAIAVKVDMVRVELDMAAGLAQQVLRRQAMGARQGHSGREKYGMYRHNKVPWMTEQVVGSCGGSICRSL